MQRFVLTLLLAVTLCSQLGHCFKAVFTNRIDEQHVKCNHSTTYPCYTKLYIPGPEFEGGIDTDSQNDRGRTFINHIRYTYDVCDASRIRSFVGNYTCSDYFCSWKAPYIIKTLLTPLPDVRWQTVHFDMINYCYYCNYTNKNEFFSQLDDSTKCHYFWRHEKSYCNNSNNVEENPTILTFAHRNYLTYKAKTIPEMASFDLTYDFNDFLELTRVRSIFEDHLTEKERWEFPYICYFPDSNSYYSVGDVYETAFLTIRFAAIPFIFMVMRWISLLVVFLVLWLPKFYDAYSKTLQQVFNGEQIKKFVWLMVSDIQFQATWFITLGFFIGWIEDFVYFPSTSMGLRGLSGLFRAAMSIFFYTGAGILVVKWAHVFHSTQEMRVSNTLSRPLRIILICFYIFIAFLILVPLIIYIVLITVTKNILFYYIATLLFVATLFLLTVAVGFTAYGVRIIYILYRTDSEMNLLKLKLTRLMLVSVIFIINSAVWTLVLGITYAAADQVWVLVIIFKAPLIDLAFMMFGWMQVYILFESERGRCSHLYGKCFGPCMPKRKIPTQVEL